MTEYEHNLMRIENWMKFSGIQNVTEKNMASHFPQDPACITKRARTEKKPYTKAQRD